MFGNLNRAGWPKTLLLSLLLLIPITTILLKSHRLLLLDSLSYAHGDNVIVSSRHHGVDRLLHFSGDGTFRIAIFEDLHFGEAEDESWGSLQDIKSQHVMAGILQTERPDLVVLNGDLVTGENTYRDNATLYLDQVVAPLLKSKIPWASTYGNHDRDFNLSASSLYDAEKKYPQGLTRRDVDGDETEVGITNYFLLIYPSHANIQRHSDEPRLILYFLDSRGGKRYQNDNPNQQGIPSRIHSEVLTWLRNTSNSLHNQYNRTIASLAFFHIPPTTMQRHQLSKQGVSPTREPGINDDLPLAPQDDDEDVIDTLGSIDGLIATFSGHDHGNDWCMRWNSLTSSLLFHCFGRRSGYGGYGDWTRGSRQLVIDQRKLVGADTAIETWIRLEDGSVSGWVSLNRTYGVDEYPEVGG